jgi:lactoylglutathione lyase
MKFAYTIVYVKDVEATLNFYEKAFGCTIRFFHENKQYGELETESTTLGFASEESGRKYMGEFQPNDPQNSLPAGFEIAFSTDDVQKAYDHALSCGAYPVRTPERKPWGQIVAYVRDLNGVVVEICTSLG